MPGFTVKNLLEVDNSAADRESGLEARFARKHLDSDHLGVSYFRYDPNFRTPFGHRHREQEEAYVVVAGSGRAKLDDEVIELSEWDVLRVGARGRAIVRGRPRRPRADRDRQRPAGGRRR